MRPSKASVTKLRLNCDSPAEARRAVHLNHLNASLLMTLGGTVDHGILPEAMVRDWAGVSGA